MNTLFTFGCSYTEDYNTCRVDTYVDYKNHMGGQYPKSWPIVLSENLNFNLKNYGEGASGNQQIFHEAYGIRTGKSLLFFLQHYKPAPWEHGLQCSDYADEDMDLVIKFEDREKGLKSLEDITGIKVDPNKKSRSRNRGKKNYRDYYDERTKSIVERSFSRDIDLYGYKF